MPPSKPLRQAPEAPANLARSTVLSIAVSDRDRAALARISELVLQHTGVRKVSTSALVRRAISLMLEHYGAAGSDKGWWQDEFGFLFGARR